MDVDTQARIQRLREAEPLANKEHLTVVYCDDLAALLAAHAALVERVREADALLIELSDEGRLAYGKGFEIVADEVIQMAREIRVALGTAPQPAASPERTEP